MTFLSMIDQLLCSHEDTPMRTDPRTGEIYLFCMACTWRSEGILTGPGAFFVTSERELERAQA